MEAGNWRRLVSDQALCGETDSPQSFWSDRDEIQQLQALAGIMPGYDFGVGDS